MEGKTARGASSPANPALHIPDPLSTTSAAISSSMAELQRAKKGGKKKKKKTLVRTLEAHTIPPASSPTARERAELTLPVQFAAPASRGRARHRRRTKGKWRRILPLPYKDMAGF